MELPSSFRRELVAAVTDAGDRLAHKAPQGLDREAWRQALGRIPDPPPAKLVADANAADLGGWSAKVMARDPATGREYLVKPQSPDELALAGESAVTRLRRKLGFPAPTVVPGRATLPDGHVVEGSAKAMIPTAGTLASDPTRWTRQQANAVMLDDPWLRLLGNHDSHVRQYIQTGTSGRTALNIDWDRSFDITVPEPTLTRYRQAHWYAPTAQSLLYKAYVEGRVDLNLKPLVRIADRLQATPDQEVLDALKPFTDKAFAHGQAYGPYATRAEFERALLARKASLGTDYRALVDQLQTERAQGRWRHPLRGMKDVLMGLVESFNGSNAYKRLSKLIQQASGST